jgi:hypothetical protein
MSQGLPPVIPSSKHRNSTNTAMIPSATKAPSIMVQRLSGYQLAFVQAIAGLGFQHVDGNPAKIVLASDLPQSGF